MTVCDIVTVWIENGQEVYRPCHNQSLDDGACYYHRNVTDGRFTPGDTYEDGMKANRPIRCEQKGVCVWTR